MCYIVTHCFQIAVIEYKLFFKALWCLEYSESLCPVFEGLKVTNFYYTLDTTGIIVGCIIVADFH